MTTPDLLRSIRLALETHRDGDAFRAEVRRLIAEHDTPPMFDTGPKARTVTRTDEPWTDQDMKHGRHVDLPGCSGFQGPPHDRHWLEKRLFEDPPEKGSFGFE